MSASLYAAAAALRATSSEVADIWFIAVATCSTRASCAVRAALLPSSMRSFKVRSRTLPRASVMVMNTSLLSVRPLRESSLSSMTCSPV